MPRFVRGSVTLWSLQPLLAGWRQVTASIKEKVKSLLHRKLSAMVTANKEIVPVLSNHFIR